MRSGGLGHLISWLESDEEDVKTQAARAMLAIASNNATTQTIIGSHAGVPPLVGVMRDGPLQAKEHSICALWHLATLKKNHSHILKCGGIPPTVAMLSIDGDIAPQLATMLLLRLAEASRRAALAIADAGAIHPLVLLLDPENATFSTQQMAAATLAALANVSRNRDPIVNAGAIKPLIMLVKSTTLATPEATARALAHLAKEEADDDDVCNKNHSNSLCFLCSFLDISQLPATILTTCGCFLLHR